MTDIAALKAAAQAVMDAKPTVEGWRSVERFDNVATPEAILSLIDRMEALEEALRDIASTFDEASYPRVGSLERFAGDRARAALNTHPVTALEGE